MKLVDLFEDLSKSISDLSTSKKVLQKEPSSMKWSRVGSPGQQAIAYQHNEQKIKNTVIKNISIFNSSDPAYQFLRLCKNHQNNPHFPKIFKVKQYPMENGGFTLVVTMEKLLPIPNDTLLLEEMFGVPYGSIPGLNLDNVWSVFEDPMLRKQVMEVTTYPSLKQAMRLLEPLFNNFFPDMHSGNIMYRKGPRGPTLVFLDPVQ